MEKRNNSAIKIESMAFHFERLKDFDKSFYKNVYKEAYLRVDDIIKHAENYGSMNSWISASFQADFPNIITLIGARGVGKTSVMLSFMEALKDYRNDNDRIGNFYTFEKEENIVFTCLDCIDGSLMEHGEDIFKTILAQMYQKFTDLETEGGIHKSSDFDFRKRELLRGLEDVYRTVCDIENMEKENSQFVPGEAYMSSLRSFSSSQKVKKDFAELIKKFTDLMRYNRYARSELSGGHYVVIAIDDIDLNIHNSFSMLEKIHRYCTVPNVIVLLALDIQQMLSIVTRHFYEVVPKVNKLLINQELYVRNLSMDYLEKVLPINYRIYMPSMDKKVIISKESNGIKASILGKIYRRSGVCFDSQGLKRHFYVPASMRELTGFYLMLESMGKIQNAHLTDGKENISGNEEELISVFEENYSILLSDLENRIALEKLSKREDVEFFRDLVRSDLRRAMSSVKAYYLNCVNRLSKQNAVISQNDLVKDIEDISYGELIETIYALGRIQNGAYKPVVHCLLAYFSYAFTRQYITEKMSYRKAEDKDGAKENTEKGMMEKIVGGHVLDKWSKELIPAISVELFANQGVQEFNGGQNLAADVECKVLGRASNVRLDNVLKLPVDGRILEDAKTEKYEALCLIMRQMEFLTLFFSDFTFSEAEQEIPWKFDFTPGMTGMPSLVFDNKRQDDVLSGRANFDLLNVIANSMYASEKLASVEEALINATAEYLKKAKPGDNRTVKRKLRKTFERYSLKREYEKWEKEFGGPAMPLPVWWFDFSYNILKRTRRNMRKKTPMVVTDISEIFRYTCEVYRCISNQITEQQNFYNTEDKERAENLKSKEDELKIAERFNACPGVKILMDATEKADKGAKAEKAADDQICSMESAVIRMFDELKNSDSEESN